MLILDVKPGKQVVIGAGENEVTITVIDYQEGEYPQFRLGFDAPRHIPIDRKEVRNKKVANIKSVMDPK